MVSNRRPRAYMKNLLVISALSFCPSWHHPFVINRTFFIVSIFFSLCQGPWSWQTLAQS